MFGVVFVAGYLFSALAQTKHALHNRYGLMGFLFVVFGIYFAWFWHKGQTIAMKAWHLAIVDKNGLAVTQGRALVRYVLSWVWLLPPLAISAMLQAKGAEIAVIALGWVAVYAVLARFAPGTQFWHDVAAGTRVVHRSPPARGS